MAQVEDTASRSVLQLWSQVQPFLAQFERLVVAFNLTSGHSKQVLLSSATTSFFAHVFLNGASVPPT